MQLTFDTIAFRWGPNTSEKLRKTPPMIEDHMIVRFRLALLQSFPGSSLSLDHSNSVSTRQTLHLVFVTLAESFSTPNVEILEILCHFFKKAFLNQ